jgi:hypothetical protein
MYPFVEYFYMIGSVYHNYRGNNIIDNGLKSSIIIEVVNLRTSGRHKCAGLSGKAISNDATYHPVSRILLRDKTVCRHSDTRR